MKYVRKNVTSVLVKTIVIKVERAKAHTDWNSISGISAPKMKKSMVSMMTAAPLTRLVVFNAADVGMLLKVYLSWVSPKAIKPETLMLCLLDDESIFVVTYLVCQRNQ